jgi:hypothetical protein
LNNSRGSSGINISLNIHQNFYINGNENEKKKGQPVPGAPGTTRVSNRPTRIGSHGGSSNGSITKKNNVMKQHSFGSNDNLYF